MNRRELSRDLVHIGLTTDDGLLTEVAEAMGLRFDRIGIDAIADAPTPLALDLRGLPSTRSAELVETAPAGPLLVLADLEQADTLFALAVDRRALLVLGDDPASLMLAFGELLEATPKVAEDSLEREREKLRRLAEEVARVSRRLAMLGERETGAQTGLGDPAIGFAPELEAERDLVRGADRVVTAQEVRAVIAARRLRNRFFDASLFADPAWDILLDLFAARLEGQQIAVSSLRIAACVPPTTALRWIGTMTETGILERSADREDRRRAHIGLSDAALRGMKAYFAALPRDTATAA